MLIEWLTYGPLFPEHCVPESRVDPSQRTLSGQICHVSDPHRILSCRNMRCKDANYSFVLNSLVNLYYYSRFVTAHRFMHEAPTTMFGVSLDSIWPTDQRLMRTFWVPASEGPEGFWREIQKFFLFVTKSYYMGVYELPRTPAVKI